MLIPSGNYKISQVLDISNSLLTQIDSEKEFKNSILKCLLNSETNQFVGYFVDLSEVLGQNSEIEIFKNLEMPLIYQKDFKVIKREEYFHNKKFISKLLKRGY